MKRYNMIINVFLICDGILTLAFLMEYEYGHAMLGMGFFIYMYFLKRVIKAKHDDEIRRD